MSAAPMSPDEPQRLQNLMEYQILDTTPEKQYDDLTFLAAHICGTPISLLSLVDRDRQWFKSHHGTSLLETPRTISFCAHAILQKSVFEIPDTTRDERFFDNTLVTEGPRIRYYAGAPLITPEGRALGTLCVLDREPRQLSADQLRSLEALARQAVSQMELWRSVRQLEVANAERAVALSVAQETTDRLLESESRFRQFMDNSPLMAFMKDEMGRFVYMNAPMEKTFGISFQQLKGKTDFDWLPPSVAEAARAHDAQVMSSGESLECIEEMPTPDGLGREWLVFKFPLKGASKPHFLGGVALDVTEQRRAERLKTEFVSVVSHELRTPLTSIRGALGLLAGGVAGEMSPSARQMIEIAQKNGDRLILLINDILDIDKIESGKMRFESTRLPLRTWLHHSVEQNRSYGVPLGVQIEVSCTSEAEDACMLADGSRLDQVLSNLLSNACKWTPRGGTVRVHAEISREMAVISVRDEGPGVPAEFVSHLFEKFGQADASSTRQKGGTGLGLAIARSLVQKMGGHIEYFAPQNNRPGATFRFHMPLCEPMESSEPDRNAASNALSATKLLICEDDPEVAGLLGVLASQNGYDPVIATTLDEARQSLAEGNFAGLTLDLMLPDGDGLDLLRELREASDDLPVVVISARSQEGKLHGEALHVLDWLEKPLEESRLSAALKSFRGGEGTCVLHVEDDADVRQVVAAILGEETAIESAATLEEARRLLGRRQYELAILDLDLRDGSGLDLVEELSATTPPTPVIVFSSQEPHPEQSRLIAASLIKSRTGNEELRDTIHRFLGKDRP